MWQGIFGLANSLIINYVSKWIFICDSTRCESALWRDKRLECSLLYARCESSNQSLCQQHCTEVEYHCHLVAGRDKYDYEEASGKTVDNVDEVYVLQKGHSKAHYMAKSCNNLVIIIRNILLHSCLSTEQMHWPLMSCSGRVPGRVHIACARCPNTVASNVDILEPIKYFLSPTGQRRDSKRQVWTRWHFDFF